MMIHICSFQLCQLASGGLLLLWLNYPTVLKLLHSPPSYSWDTHISNIWLPWKKKISLPAPSGRVHSSSGVKATLFPVTLGVPFTSFCSSFSNYLLSYFPCLVWVLFCTRDWVSSFSQELCYGLISLALGNKSIVLSENWYLMGRSTELTLV